MHFLECKLLYFDKNFTEGYSEVDSKTALILEMACCRSGDKPLPDRVLTNINDNLCCH